MNSCPRFPSLLTKLLQFALYMYLLSGAAVRFKLGTVGQSCMQFCLIAKILELGLKKIKSR